MPRKKKEEPIEEPVEVSDAMPSIEPPSVKAKKRTMTPEMLQKLALAREKALEVKRKLKNDDEAKIEHLKEKMKREKDKKDKKNGILKQAQERLDLEQGTAPNAENASVVGEDYTKPKVPTPPPTPSPPPPAPQPVQEEIPEEPLPPPAPEPPLNRTAYGIGVEGDESPLKLNVEEPPLNRTANGKGVEGDKSPHAGKVVDLTSHEALDNMLKQYHYDEKLKREVEEREKRFKKKYIKKYDSDSDDGYDPKEQVVYIKRKQKERPPAPRLGFDYNNHDKETPVPPSVMLARQLQNRYR
jgi:hypothetical protein